MKRSIKILAIMLLVVTTSCTSVRVATDYDKTVSFENYKTFAFSKTGIDKAEINDLDKKRILRAVEAELLAKGLTKSDTPDLLISFFTKSRENVNVYNNMGFGFGYGPLYWNNYNTVSRSTEGVLYIDLIDANKKDLVWQGIGTGYLLTHNVDQKEARIKEFVASIMSKYPPGKN